MPKKRKHENADDEQRLKVEFPGIYSDFLAGRISLRKAVEAAGLKPQRTRLQKLRNSWKKATAEERDAFLAWLGETGTPPRTAANTAMAQVTNAGAMPIATGRYLLPATVIRIKRVMAKRRLSSDEVMAEMGFGPDPALNRALRRNASLRLAVIAALEAWLQENADA